MSSAGIDSVETNAELLMTRKPWANSEGGSTSKEEICGAQVMTELADFESAISN